MFDLKHDVRSHITYRRETDLDVGKRFICRMSRSSVNWYRINSLETQNELKKKERIKTLEHLRRKGSS